MQAPLPWEDNAVQERATDTLVNVSRRFPVPRERVFAAWTEAEEVRRWFGIRGSVEANVDARPGGSYRISVEPPAGLPVAAKAVGTYLEVVPPERLVFTFGWELAPLDEADLGDLAGVEDLQSRLADLADLDSRVTVEFRDVEGSTEVSITHERLATQNLRAFHVFGWESSLRNLAAVLG